MSIIHPQDRQLSLLHSGSDDYKTPENFSTPALGLLKKQFNIAAQNSVIIHESACPHPLVELCPDIVKPIRGMAAHQRVEKLKSHAQATPEAQDINLLARVGWGLYLGESSQSIFEQYEAALGKGNKGATWTLKNNIANLRAVNGSKPHFTLSKPSTNKYASIRPNLFIIGRCQKQSTGSVFIELVGSCWRDDISRFFIDRERFYQVSIPTLQKNGLLYPADAFRRHFKGTRDAS